MLTPNTGFWQHIGSFPVALKELLSGHHARLGFHSAEADFVFSPHIFHYFVEQCGGKHPIAKQACFVDMFVIQLMHYLEAAGCGTSIQLALSATVHRSPNYFWWFSSFNYCWTADNMDTLVVNGRLPPVVQASVWNGHKAPTLKPVSLHCLPYIKRACHRNSKVLISVQWKMYKLYFTQLPNKYWK